jgi:hypothetical protein
MTKTKKQSVVALPRFGHQPEHSIDLAFSNLCAVVAPYQIPHPRDQVKQYARGIHQSLNNNEPVDVAGWPVRKS